MTLGRPGDLLADRYRLDRFVGAAGSVERWQAYDERLARPVTARLEPAPGDSADQDESTAAAQSALTRVAQLRHPGVAAVYDAGTADSLRGSAVGYAISEWTEGRTLSQIMAAGPQPWARTADWGRQLSGALAALHGIGIAHGALSPASVAIHDNRQVKILDAGLDSVPPDRAGAGEIDGEAPGDGEGDLPAGAPNDVYALGFLLWEATAGAEPQYVVPEAEADAGAATADDAEDAGAGHGDGAAAQDTAETGPLRPIDAEPTVAGIDQQPLLDTGAPAGLAALLSAMLAADAALRPTAAEAERRFLPFAAVERASDTLPVVAAAAARTQVLGPPVAGAAASAAAAQAAKEHQDRRRGAMLGLGLLAAAVLAGLGFLLANLNSHPTNPNDVNTTVPSSSPGMVTLPNGSLSPAPSRTQTGGGQATSAAPSAPASSPTGQASTSAPASPSAPASSTTAPSSSASAQAGGGNGASSSSAPIGASPSSSGGHIHTSGAVAGASP